ncbi:MAG: methyltransferase domain-containing protein [bacterium]|nr:methyltransferase domain-containing protein [bacterium]
MQLHTPPLSAAEILRLPFDQYQRYRLVTEILGRIRNLRHPLRILDVGGRTALLRSFLPEDEVTLVDLESSDAVGLVLGDGSHLPFADNSFDVVTGCDTLEHIPPDVRRDFVAECARVSHGYVILAGPFFAPEVDEAEELLYDFMKSKLALDHRYLREHRELGLPDRAVVGRWFEECGGRVMNVGHARLDRWLALMCMSMYMDNDPLLRPLASRFFAFYNERMFESDRGPSVYRHAVVAALEEAPLPDCDVMFAGNENGAEANGAGASPVETAGALARELVAFDREQDVWRPEIERLEGVVGGLVQDLEGHREKLTETEQDLVGHREKLAATEHDLHAHVEAVGELRERLTAERAGFEAVCEDLRGELAEHARQRDIERAAEHDIADKLRADLEGHRAVMADVRADAEGLRAEGEALRADREAHITHKDVLLAELEATSTQSELVRTELRAEIERLRNELRPRLKNLKRAFRLDKGPY